jgi:hypothetical protein
MCRLSAAPAPAPAGNGGDGGGGVDIGGRGGRSAVRRGYAGLGMTDLFRQESAVGPPFELPACFFFRATQTSVVMFCKIEFAARKKQN